TAVSEGRAGGSGLAHDLLEVAVLPRDQPAAELEEIAAADAERAALGRGAHARPLGHAAVARHPVHAVHELDVLDLGEERLERLSDLRLALEALAPGLRPFRDVEDPIVGEAVEYGVDVVAGEARAEPIHRRAIVRLAHGELLSLA